MLSFDYYLASIKNFLPQFGWAEFLRLRTFSQIDLDEIGSRLKLPGDWIRRSEDWYKHQSEISKVIWAFSEEYPPELLNLQNPPLFIFTQGDWESKRWSSIRRLSIVGSREASNQVLRWMDMELSRFLNSTPALILSGGARGVDQKAHFLAQRNSLPTWVFFPSGLDQLYPQTWKGWSEDFLSSGGVFISEYPRGQMMRKHHFIRRNELIVALSDACFVVQAARRSGSYLTARMAQSTGVSLAALSHFPSERNALGCLDLLVDGANLIRDAEDLQVWLLSSSTK